MSIVSKKSTKIITWGIIFLTLPSLLFCGFMFLKYNEDLPSGTTGKMADALAQKMLDALNYDAYKNTNYIEWTYKQRRHYEWKKDEEICQVYWEEYRVHLNLNDHKLSRAYIHSFKIEGDMGEKLKEKALNYFNNDSFWLVAPYKVFDAGVERRLVNNNSLLVTYTSGDSFLWKLDPSGKPKYFKMWSSSIPLDGLEASWNHWITTDSGAQLPTFHKLFLIGLEMGAVKGSL